MLFWSCSRFNEIAVSFNIDKAVWLPSSMCPCYTAKHMELMQTSVAYVCLYMPIYAYIGKHMWLNYVCRTVRPLHAPVLCSSALAALWASVMDAVPCVLLIRTHMPGATPTSCLRE